MGRYIPRILWLITLLWGVLYVVSPAYADDTAGRRGKLVILLIPGAMVEDITATDLPSFQSLLRSGACAVMTTRTAGTPAGRPPSTTRTEAASLTLGSGARSASSTETRSAYNSDEMLGRESASRIYKRQSLNDAPPSSIVHLGIYEIRANNRALPYDVRPGLVGESLNAAGLVTACVGNSDTNRAPHREAAAICMNEEGVVNMGDVGAAMTRRNPNAPYGVETNQEALLAAFDAAADRADLIVIDSGDVARADWYSDECADQQARLLRKWAIHRTDHLLGEIMRRLDKRNSMLMVVSHCPAGSGDSAGGKMTPVLATGMGISKGLLTSASTRRPGIIANTDIAPTALQFFGLKRSGSVTGRPITSTAFSDAQTELVNLDKHLALQGSRLVVVRTTALVLVIVVILGTIAASRPAIATRLALLPPVTALTMLVIPTLGSHSPSLTGGLAVALAAVCLILASLLRLKADQALAWVSALFCAAVVLDLARGGVWLAISPFSYSPTEGSRYYGLGNELMGSLIGATTITAFGFVHPCGKWAARVKQSGMLLCLTLFGGMILLIGSPNAGANMGGALAAIVAAGAAAYMLREGRLTPKDWTVAGIVPIFLFLTFLTIDGMRGSAGQSHLGRAFEMVTGGGVGQLTMILERKLAMNLKLLQVSMWSKLLFVCIGALLYLRLWRRPIHPEQHALPTLSVIVIGALAALIFNDSGVVAAATCLMYAWSLALISDSKTKAKITA